MKMKVGRKSGVKSGARLQNKKARFDFQIGETYKLGLVLSGPIVRAVRMGRVNLTGSYINLKNDELWLTGARFVVPESASNTIKKIDTEADVKLLATKKQIGEISQAKKEGNSVVPLEILNKGRYIKLIGAIARGKKKYDKRADLKKKANDRDEAREMKRF